MYRYFANKCRSQADAEDLVSETFLRCSKNLGTLKDPNRFMSYLYGVAHYVLCEYLRKVSVLGSRFIPLETTISDIFGPSPSSIIDHREEEKILVAALRKLKLEEQILIELVYFAGHTQREVSEIVEIPLGSVGGKINDIRRKLEKEVAEHQASETDKEASLIRLHSWAKHIAQERGHQGSCKS